MVKLCFIIILGLAGLASYEAFENHALNTELAKANGPITWTLNGHGYGVRDRQHAVYTFCRLQWFVYQKTGKYYLKDSDPSFEDAPSPAESQLDNMNLKPQR